MQRRFGIMWDMLHARMKVGNIQQRKEDLFDEYECFCAIGNESIMATTLSILISKPTSSCQKRLSETGAVYSIVDTLAMVPPTLQMFFHTQLQVLNLCQSSNDALMATMTQIANLLSGFQKQFQPTNNQLRTSSNSRTHATVHDGHIVTEPIQRKAPANHEEIDQTWMKAPMLLSLSWPTCHPTSATNNPVNEVHSNDNQIFDNVDYQLSQEMHQEEHLDSDAETEIDDNTIPYHQYLLDTKPKMFQLRYLHDTSDKVSMMPSLMIAYQLEDMLRQVPKGSLVVQIVLWYLDSGCSRHMTGDRARLINFVEKFIGTVRFGNDEYAALWLWLESCIPTAYVTSNYDMVDLLKGSRIPTCTHLRNDMMPASQLLAYNSLLFHEVLVMAIVGCESLNFGTLND
ncbi:hypothetical protein Tco_0407609 [Tanacetum coccineum]